MKNLLPQLHFFNYFTSWCPFDRQIANYVLQPSHLARLRNETFVCQQRYIVELRRDVEALSLGELVTGAKPLTYKFFIC